MATQAKIGLLVPSYFSGGRLTLGISLGGRDNEFESLGVRIKQRVGIFQEGLTLMRKLWSEDNVTFHGRYYHVDNVNMDPKPIQKPTIPVVMGGRADAVLKRSAEVDGWVAGGQGSPEAYAESWKKVRAYAVAAGKDPDALESGRLMYICVGDDREQCRLRIRAYTDAYYGPQFDVESNCAFGPPEECAARIQSFVDAGAKTMLLGPTWPDVDQISRISRDVVPLLR